MVAYCGDGAFGVILTVRVQSGKGLEGIRQKIVGFAFAAGWTVRVSTTTVGEGLETQGRMLWKRCVRRWIGGGSLYEESGREIGRICGRRLCASRSSPDWR